jgi:hypothetical protein
MQTTREHASQALNRDWRSYAFTFRHFALDTAAGEIAVLVRSFMLKKESPPVRAR